MTTTAEAAHIDSSSDQVKDALTVEARDEIEQIMSDIEQLQDEMDRYAFTAKSVNVTEISPSAEIPLDSSSILDMPTDLEGDPDMNGLKEFASSETDLPPPEEMAEKPGNDLLGMAEVVSEPLQPNEVAPTPTPAPALHSVPPAPPQKIKDLLSTQVNSVLSMTIQGNMAVQLNFGQKGEWMSLEFDDENITIHLSNGMILKVPRTSQSQKVA